MQGLSWTLFYTTGTSFMNILKVCGTFFCLWLFHDFNVLGKVGFDTAWKVFKYGVFSGSYFSVNFCIQVKYGKVRTRKNSVFGHFLLSMIVIQNFSVSEILLKFKLLKYSFLHILELLHIDLFFIILLVYACWTFVELITRFRLYHDFFSKVFCHERIVVISDLL